MWRVFTTLRWSNLRRLLPGRPPLHFGFVHLLPATSSQSHPVPDSKMHDSGMPWQPILYGFHLPPCSRIPMPADRHLNHPRPCRHRLYGVQPKHHTRLRRAGLAYVKLASNSAPPIRAQHETHVPCSRHEQPPKRRPAFWASVGWNCHPAVGSGEIVLV